jgi:hypothetical protein
MSILSRQFVVAMTITLLLAGCSHPTATTPAAPSLNPDGARLSRSDVLRIAGEAATKHGFHLSDYKDRQDHCEFAQKENAWTVFYEGKVLRIGNDCLVWVDDRTGEAHIIPGM